MNDYKKYNLKRAHNMTVIDYNSLLARQDNRCAICNTHMLEFKRSLHVDHDHKTGSIRGLLCHNCNVGLGQFKDSITRLSQAIKYLEENN